jgi:hypothetical protein
MKKLILVLILGLASTASFGEKIKSLKMLNAGPDGYKNVTYDSKWNGAHIKCWDPGPRDCFGFASNLAQDPREKILLGLVKAAIESGQNSGTISHEGLAAHWSGSLEDTEVILSGE